MQMLRAKRSIHHRYIVAAVFVVAAVITGGIVYASTNSQTASTSPIYYVSTASGDADIWSVIPGQKPVRMPWNSRGIPDTQPAVSPDGRWLAYASKRTGDYEIWVVDLRAGSKAKPIQISRSTSSDTDPAWSPDSRQIAYVTNKYGPEEIMVAPVGGCSRFAKVCPTRVTTNKSRDLHPAWSPDGRTIAFSSQRGKDPSLQIYTMSPTGASVRKLTSDKAASTQPSWSPDGRSIAFISKRSTDKTPSVYTMTSRGSSQRRITSGGTNDAHPSWSPDSKEITFGSNISRNLDVYRVGATGGRVTRVTTSKSADHTAAWANPAVAVKPTATPRPPTPTPLPTSAPLPPTPTPTTAPPTPTPAPTATQVPTTSGGGGGFGRHGSVNIGFKVSSEGTGSQGIEDTSWESITGGSMEFELSDSHTGLDQFSQISPTSRFISDIELRGPVASGNGEDRELHETDHFTVDIENLPTESNLVDSIRIEPIVIPAIEVTLIADLGQKVFTPGQPQYGEMTITVQRSDDSGGLLEWWQDFSQGQNIRKEIIVSSLRRDGSVGRTWTFFDAVPVDYFTIGEGLGTAGTVPGETIVLRYSRVEFGETNGPRRDLESHLNATLNDQPAIRTMTITEIVADGSDGGSLTYDDVFPTKYVFPEFSFTRTDSQYEEIHLKPNSLEQ